MPLVTSCAQVPVKTTTTDYRTPPESLLESDEVPDYTGRTFGDVLEYSLRLQNIIKRQNADKAAVREWIDNVKDEDQ